VCFLFPVFCEYQEYRAANLVLNLDACSLCLQYIIKGERKKNKPKGIRGYIMPKIYTPMPSKVF
jgi:hypothetical protein